MATTKSEEIAAVEAEIAEKLALIESYHRMIDDCHTAQAEEEEPPAYLINDLIALDSAISEEQYYYQSLCTDLERLKAKNENEKSDKEAYKDEIVEAAKRFCRKDHLLTNAANGPLDKLFESDWEVATKYVALCNSRQHENRRTWLMLYLSKEVAMGVVIFEPKFAKAQKY